MEESPRQGMAHFLQVSAVALAPFEVRQTSEVRQLDNFNCYFSLWVHITHVVIGSDLTGVH